MAHPEREPVNEGAALAILCLVQQSLGLLRRAAVCYHPQVLQVVQAAMVPSHQRRARHQVHHPNGLTAGDRPRQAVAVLAVSEMPETVPEAGPEALLAVLRARDAFARGDQGADNHEGRRRGEWLDPSQMETRLLLSWLVLVLIKKEDENAGLSLRLGSHRETLLRVHVPEAG